MDKIIVDTDEKNYITKIFDVKNVPYERKKIQADYSNSKSEFAIERKNAQDFRSSLLDGSLERQCMDMKKNYPGVPRYVLYEGDFEAQLNDSWKNKGLYAKMLTFRYHCAALYGVEFIETWERMTTVKVIKQIAKSASYFYTSHGTFEGLNVRKKEDKRLLMLMPIPTIGKKMSKKLLDKFKTVKRVLDANKSDFTSIKGIGEKGFESKEKFYKGRSKCK